jgi:hypothetical protein
MKCLLPWLVVALLTSFPLDGWTQPAAPAPKVLLPPLPSSPVDLFRKLLATNAAGRQQWLETKPLATRQYVESKVNEYEALPAEQREARLQALEMRWYMRYFMSMNPLERAPRLAAVPEPERRLLQRQLGQWDILPPQLKKDVLENENLIRVVVGETGKVENIFATMTDEQKAELERQYERWNQLPPERREQIMANFKKVFEMPDADRNKALARLTETERAQMEATLSRFGSLSKDEREQAMQGFKKFAELSPAEQAAFLKTAQRWKTMSEEEKQLWRKVVASLQEKRSPPLPPTQSSVRAPTLSSTN